MSTIIARIFRWLANKLLVLLIIVAILVAAMWVRAEWNQIRAGLADAALNESLASRLEAEAAPIEQRRAELEASLAEITAKLAAAQNVLETARKAESLALSALDSVRDEKRWYYTKLTHASYFARLEAATLKWKTTQNITKAALLNQQQLQQTLASSPAGDALIRIRAELSARSHDIRNLRHQAATTRAEAARRPIERLRSYARQVLPTALLVLGGVILAPLLIKALLFFVVAPVISRTRPVVVFPESSGELLVSDSAVSIPLELEPGDHLIVHSDFLQAAGAGPGKSTRFLFSWRMPFTSMAAGLFLMVAVRNPLSEPQKVTVAPKKELFDMLCSIRIPDGSSMVVYPRSLVGLVLTQGKHPRITRHWKLGSLHSWITFQFRYIVIHGPCLLVIKGCRGVRADQVEPSKPRQQDQCATLGFSANLAYSGVRCETFVDYLLGRDGLFNDRFSDANGFHLTEEIPDPRQKSGLFGRGLEGLMDGFLKAFGI